MNVSGSLRLAKDGNRSTRVESGRCQIDRRTYLRGVEGETPHHLMKPAHFPHDWCYRAKYRGRSLAAGLRLNVGMCSRRFITLAPSSVEMTHGDFLYVPLGPGVRAVLIGFLPMNTS